MGIKTLKHYIKLLIGRPDPDWPLFVFEKKIHNDTWENRARLLAEAEEQLSRKDQYERDELYEKSSDPLVKQGYKLKKETENSFRNILDGKSTARVLIHVPEAEHSPAGFSLFTNFAESFDFIGIPTKILGWNDSTEQILNEFKPNIFLTSDHFTYLERIDWEAVNLYRKNNALKIGLTASPENMNPLLSERLDWAEKQNVDFYYSFRDPSFVHTQESYKPFFDKGYKILFLPFGVNILHYYPVPNIEKDIDYVFLASVNKTKGARYKNYMLPIVSKYTGFIDGPGWKKIEDFNFNADRDRYIYARSKVGLNIHLEEQVAAANEVNERTYQLAACGVPQVTDNAKLLSKLFPAESLFIAEEPNDYLQHFEEIMRNPQIGEKRALLAQQEVFEKHTTFHRAYDFIKQLEKHGFAQ